MLILLDSRGVCLQREFADARYIKYKDPADDAEFFTRRSRRRTITPRICQQTAFPAAALAFLVKCFSNLSQIWETLRKYTH